MAKICVGLIGRDPCGQDLEALGAISYKIIRISEKFTIARPACSKCGENIIEFEDTRDTWAKRRREREAAAQGNP